MLIEGEKLNPRAKPITMVLMPHRDQDVEHLGAFKKAITDVLVTSPTGKVAIVLEAASTTTKDSEKVRKLVAKGVTPSRAMRRKLSLKERLLKLPLTEYNEERSRILDEVAKEFPNRIDIIFEGHSPEALEQVKRPKEDNWLFSYNPEVETWKDALKATVARAKRRAKGMAIRDESIVDQVKGALEDPEVIASVGLMGSSHTPITHDLVREGYTVHRVFPNAQNGVYSFSPIDTYERDVRFFPNKERSLSDLDLAIQTEAQLVPSPSETEQDFIQRQHKWAKYVKDGSIAYEQRNTDQEIAVDQEPREQENVLTIPEEPQVGVSREVTTPDQEADVKQTNGYLDESVMRRYGLIEEDTNAPEIQTYSQPPLEIEE